MATRYTITTPRAQAVVRLTGPAAEGSPGVRLARAVLTWARSVRAEMDQVAKGVAANSPRRTGKFAQTLGAQITARDDSEVKIAALSQAPYARYVRWSRYTAGEIRQMAARYGRGKAALRTSVDQETYTRIAVFLAKRLGRKPTLDEIQNRRLHQLLKRHGAGAPSDALRGKSVYAYLRKNLDYRKNAPRWYDRLRALTTEALGG